MPLWTDPKYQALALVAAERMGTKNTHIVYAILAQWACEKGNNDAYPPARNNPGNLARGAVPAGFRYYVTSPNPQPGNPIVTFYSPNEGAAAYAQLLINGSQVGERYAAVMSAVRAGDGHAFIEAMGHSGYGTSTACMLSTYHPPAAPPTDAPAPTKEDVLKLVPGIVYKTKVICKPGFEVLGSPGGASIYKTKAGDKFPEVGDYISDHGDYHVMRMPGDIAGFLGHGMTLGTEPA